MRKTIGMIAPIFWAFFFVMLCVALCEAEVCMSNDTAAKHIVTVERCKIDAEICGMKNEEIDLLGRKYGECRKIIVLKDSELSIKDGAITSLNGLVEKERDECAAMLTAAKPSLLKQVSSILGAIGLGILIGVLAL